MADIRYVHLDASKFWADLDWGQRWDAETRGVYDALVFAITMKGSIPADIDFLKDICKSNNFDSIWLKIKVRFPQKGNRLYHSEVNTARNRALKVMQAKRRAGVASGMSRRKKVNICSTQGEQPVELSKVKESKVKESKETDNRSILNVIKSVVKKKCPHNHQSTEKVFEKIQEWLTDYKDADLIMNTIPTLDVSSGAYMWQIGDALKKGIARQDSPDNKRLDAFNAENKKNLAIVSTPATKDEIRGAMANFKGGK